MENAQIRQVRSFNRLVTQRVGALQESYVSRGRPLAEARLLFDIGVLGGADLRVLRGRLGLDSGYLSRLLRSLEGQGMVVVTKSAEDGRVREVTLTGAGQAEYETYDALSDRLAEAILDPLGDGQRLRLVQAMAEVEALLRISGLEIAVEPPENADARWCLAQYFAELVERFEAGFNPANGNMLTDAEMTPPAGWLLVARLDGDPVGCGALKRMDNATGEIKRVWTAPSVRGFGVASRLMDRLEALAREQGFKTVKLDTNKSLTEAHSLYRKRGYREIARYNDNPYAHHWFERQIS
jgi:DNA-binding MarR family transcriptional regulator/GNAT superfamily N-acetyltransferase